MDDRLGDDVDRADPVAPGPAWGRLIGSGLIAAVAVPYFSLLLWLEVGGQWSRQGRWPHWQAYSGYGHMPDQGWDFLMAMTLICFPIPVVLYACGVASVAMGLTIVARHRVVLLWVIPELLLLMGVLVPLTLAVVPLLVR